MYFVPDDEAIRLTDSPQTRMKPRFVRNRDSYSYNNFTTIRKPLMKRHGTAATLAVPFCYNSAELNETERRFPVKGVWKIAAEEREARPGCP